MVPKAAVPRWQRDMMAISNEDDSFLICGEGPQTMYRILLECQRIHPINTDGVTVPEIFGFKDRFCVNIIERIR